ncbi:MAG TPA: NUDIX domain-containing protein [Herpetosiphon sp.]|uniref:NUDIX hydrolase n=1 Tax=Herpetosiphon aurantiacus (strain ATCC 23779 / DSM 785 / 114-95) TaxID=316274 RepID=A9B3L3_HERA2|nr:NUDIX domain-containing protein [Herpetosiphon sp.]ABX05585.1 NUDIX hydrolase [Herpetosiphon aurantiacus DSM 785]HBW52132.1 NUDIX domain-containing protein [Herpetosiphon sp.]
MPAFQHCHWCGAAFGAVQGFPRVCSACGNSTYRNPIPVSVILLPVERGLLTVRRAIEPRKGQLALPGGFVNVDESWQAAGVREVFEETNIQLDPHSIRDWWTRSTPDGMILIFGLAQPIRRTDVPNDFDRSETEALVVIDAPQVLAFPLHNEAMQAYFERLHG